MSSGRKLQRQWTEVLGYHCFIPCPTQPKEYQTRTTCSSIILQHVQKNMTALMTSEATGRRSEPDSRDHHNEGMSSGIKLDEKSMFRAVGRTSDETYMQQQISTCVDVEEHDGVDDFEAIATARPPSNTMMKRNRIAQHLPVSVDVAWEVQVIRTHATAWNYLDVEIAFGRSHRRLEQTYSCVQFPVTDLGLIIIRPPERTEPGKDPMGCTDGDSEFLQSAEPAVIQNAWSESNGWLAMGSLVWTKAAPRSNDKLAVRARLDRLQGEHRVGPRARENRRSDVAVVRSGTTAGRGLGQKGWCGLHNALDVGMVSTGSSTARTQHRRPLFCRLNLAAATRSRLGQSPWRLFAAAGAPGGWEEAALRAARPQFFAAWWEPAF
ncbi:uncharacterized protein B0H18DRAFT_1105578 [Fomitopsis serialis]|uniref:uncharacterized protein n=1 Tax=Fomitopsis serialis TaxID=139415 RepID=UPI0020087A24|nr:uncharacterized protein B0H18DRAFT_1105578 [Neoantrodia serialis]KAH9922464.1 hypothetical protein B0H18DRAFT_1105578 [Neoantrodia serialis]